MPGSQVAYLFVYASSKPRTETLAPPSTLFVQVSLIKGQLNLVERRPALWTILTTRDLLINAVLNVFSRLNPSSACTVRDPLKRVCTQVGAGTYNSPYSFRGAVQSRWTVGHIAQSVFTNIGFSLLVDLNVYCSKSSGGTELIEVS